MAYAVEIGAITQSAADQYMMHFYEGAQGFSRATEQKRRRTKTLASALPDHRRFAYRTEGKAHIGVKPGNESRSHWVTETLSLRLARWRKRLLSTWRIQRRL